MLKIPRVALFKAEQESEESILELFQRHEYSLRLVKAVDEIEGLVDEEAAPFDAIVVPLKLHDQSNGISACLEVKSNEQLSTVPLCVLATTADHAILQSLYGAGADVVFPAPFDPDWVFYQIGALARMRREFEARLSAGFTETSLMHPVVGAFHSLRQGILVFDSRFNLSFANRAAGVLLGLRDDESAKAVSQQFLPYLKEHQNAAQLIRADGARGMGTSTFQAILNKYAGQNFDVELSVTSLLRDDNSVIGYSAAITDMSELEHLSNTLLQAQRTRTLVLLTVAASTRFLEMMLESSVLAPIRYVKEFLDEAKPPCQMEPTLTALMDGLDLVVNPEVNVRVKVEQDLNLAVSPPDFMQLVGQMILHAVEHAGTAGETLLYCAPSHDGVVTITLTSQAHKSTPLVEGDLLSGLVHSDFAFLAADGDDFQKASPGLVSGEKIANKYGSSIEYQNMDDAVIKLRVKLPVADD